MAERGGILGIDAGGTFTDLVFLSKSDMQVKASVKVTTHHDDLLRTISEGIGLILEQMDRANIENVHLASTLATNATVENKMAASGLILIGYEESDVASAMERKVFGDARVVSLPGGHDIRGNERQPLDELMLLSVCGELMQKHIKGVAISGYFSVRNPSHEIRARDLLLTQYPGLSVTCGHELVSELDAFKRATTAAINAGLIPIVRRLLDAVKRVLADLGISAPLSIIKGDGSLVSADWAARHPVETVVSGPAASAMGARFLGGTRGNARRAWVLDIGGTTTDIIGLDKHGNPLPKNDGAVIGGHQILIKTIDIRTFGLGGDSHISRMRDGSLKVGPRRVTPLAVAAQNTPEAIHCLEEIIGTRATNKEPVLFLSGTETQGKDQIEERLIKKLSAGIRTLEELVAGESLGTAREIVQNIDRYEDRGILTLASFTPTDALLVLGLLDKWPHEASVLGARLLAGHSAKPCSEISFCREVCERVASIAAREVFVKAMTDAGLFSAREAGHLPLLGIGLRSAQPCDIPHVALKLNGDVIGVGAPAWAFMGETAGILGEKAILPRNAEVAGAVGAAVGTFFMRHTILITPLKSGEFRVHMPNGVCDYESLAEAEEQSVKYMIPWLEGLAKSAGGRAVAIDWERQDEIARISGGTQNVLLWSRILFSVRDKEERT